MLRRRIPCFVRLPHVAVDAAGPPNPSELELALWRASRGASLDAVTDAAKRSASNGVEPEAKRAKL